MRSPAPALVAAAAPVLPSRAEIDAVVAMADPILRNLWITYTYHCLELALGEALGGGDLSWCAYGTWASKTAGRFIRGEVIPGLVHELVGRGSALLGRILAQVDRRIRGSVAEGNLKVFAELAPRFRALVDVLRAPAAGRRDALAVLLAGLRPGASERGGQEALRRAFTAYVEASEVDDPKARAELIFLANALVGYHEQIRLQGPIEAALAAPSAVLVEGRALALRGGLIARIDQSLRALLTRHLMVLELPEGGLRLGDDVPRLGDGAMFPAPLAAIQNPEVQALLEVLDRTPDDLDGSAANDWSRLDDRMNYIVDVFRSRQRDRSLRRAPFSARQVAAIRDFHCPYGPL
ncbi:MAG: hypothetical protein H6711_33520 [Myxococcales bacterium]|nr:hypothetical protein [Myxococcales bacterium]